MTKQILMMPVLNIFSLDDVDFKNIIVSLSKGSHIIGRGDLLNITDKRVSRKHALIDITDDAVTLTSIHQNPCFIKASQSTIITILKQNDQHEFNSGDQFALMPDKYWFKVKINNTSVQSNESENINGKRYLENNIEPDLDVYSKKIRIEPDSNNGEHHNSVSVDIITQLAESDLAPKSEIIQNLKLEPVEPTSNNSENIREYDIQIDDSRNTNENIYLEKNNKSELDVPSKEMKIKPDSDVGHYSNSVLVDIKVEPDQCDSVLKNEITQDIKLETVDIKLEKSENIPELTGNDGQISNYPTEQGDTKTLNCSTEEVTLNVTSSNQQKIREKCWYGEKCFRKNPAHKELYSHPGDDDYVSNTNDNVPDCPYGVSCYRKNIAHQQQYRHPTKSNNEKQTLRKRKPKLAPDPSNQTPEDDYDYDDPFINDGSSDDFQPSDYEDNDSDWENSGEMAEEFEERKQLLKEANKFTKAP